MNIVWIVILVITAALGGAFVYLMVNKIRSGQKSIKDKSL
ncbi:hypothetical protein Cycma_1467 [Cyclobacterium marinum DSM 745]|uniref:Uncharacterized protein n=1 Tax=Cyclobacterium marinum (strain ATCC 25205 / DSM 745 / LMG 13164 / NCIMB 1802) TaxID=880070 RepID=G0J3N0_CYCMS|nr:hypothetical protein Cycma_1467 [Cyclobacterium marinum DSM 745]